jgi:hypothetical protein
MVLHNLFHFEPGNTNNVTIVSNKDLTQCSFMKWWNDNTVNKRNKAWIAAIGVLQVCLTEYTMEEKKTI